MYEGSEGGWRWLHRALFLDWTPAHQPPHDLHTLMKLTLPLAGKPTQMWDAKKIENAPTPIRTSPSKHTNTTLWTFSTPLYFVVLKSSWVLQSHRRTWKCPLVCYVKKTCLFPNNLSVLQYWKRQNELYGFSYLPHVTLLREKYKKGSCWFDTVDINFLNYPLMVKSWDGSQARDTENQNKIEEKLNL